MPIQPPQRDDQGRAIPHDHAQLDPPDVIIRKVSKYHLVPDEKTGGLRISSMLYEASDEPLGGMSINIEKLIIEAGENPAEYVTSPRWPGSVSFSTGDLRGLGLMVGYDPIDEDPHHGEVWGTFTKSMKRKLQNLAVWYVPIDGAHTV